MAWLYLYLPSQEHGYYGKDRTTSVLNMLYKKKFVGRASKEWLPTPIFWPGEFHGQRSLVGYSLWSRKESDMTELLSARTRAHTHTQTHTQ